MKHFLLSIASIFLIGLAAKADTVAFVADGATYEGSGETVTVSGNVDVKFTANGICSINWTQTGNNPSNVTSSQIRWYANDILNISPDNGVTITQITFTDKNSKSPTITASIGKITTTNRVSTWVGEATEAFTIKTTAQIRVPYIEITYTRAEGTLKTYNPSFKDIKMVLGDEPVSLELGDNIPSIAFQSSDDNVAKVEDGAVVATGAGTATITATWPEDTEWNGGSAYFDVTVLSERPKTDVITVDNFDGIASYNDYTSNVFENGSQFKVFAMKGNGNTIQMNSNKDKGFVTLVSAGNIASVTVAGNMGKGVNLFFSNTPYTTTDTPTGDPAITLTTSGETYTVEGDYQYVAIMAANSAVYLESITIEWAKKEEEKIELPEICINGEPIDESISYGEVSFGNIPEGVEIYYAFVEKTATEVALQAENDETAEVPSESEFTKYGAPFTLEKAGTLYYYAQKGAIKSEIASVAVTGKQVSTAIDTVVVDNDAEEEYYNLQGVRVNGDVAPGLYIVKKGNEVKKVIVR